MSSLNRQRARNINNLFTCHSQICPFSTTIYESEKKFLYWLALPSENISLSNNDYSSVIKTNQKMWNNGEEQLQGKQETQPFCGRLWEEDWDIMKVSKPFPLFFFFLLFIYLFIFSFIFISWRLITLQYCSGFCHTLTWISHVFTCIPHPDPPSHLPLYPIPLSLPSAPGLSTCLMHPTWAGDLFYPR